MLTFVILPVPEEPAEKDRTFDAGIVIDSFGGALGLERSLAFLRLRPSVSISRARMSVGERSVKSFETLATVHHSSVARNILASSEADGDTKVKMPS